MKKRILLVDDDNVAHFINRRLLEVSQFTEQIGVANNGEEAIQYITQMYESSRKVPDVIFLDVNMPVMNGFRFIETLRTLLHLPYEKIEIVVLSSSNHERDKETAIQLGIKHYFNKPLSTQVIHNLFCTDQIVKE